MSRSLRGPALFVFLFLLSAALPILAQVSQTVNVSQQPPVTATPVAVSTTPIFHGVPWRDPNTTAAVVGFAAPAGAHLTYRGGPIISNVQVIQVLYGSGSYNPQIAGTSSPTMGNFFSDITTTGLITLLQQYNTNISGGTGQVFRGTAHSADCFRLFRQRAITVPPLLTRRSSRNFWPRSLQVICLGRLTMLWVTPTPFI